MTKKEAMEVVAELMGWDKPQVRVKYIYDGYLHRQKTYYVTAIDPLSGTEKAYDETDGYFK